MVITLTNVWKLVLIWKRNFFAKWKKASQNAHLFNTLWYVLDRFDFYPSCMFNVHLTFTRLHANMLCVRFFASPQYPSTKYGRYCNTTNVPKKTLLTHNASYFLQALGGQVPEMGDVVMLLLSCCLPWWYRKTNGCWLDILWCDNEFWHSLDTVSKSLLEPAWSAIRISPTRLSLTNNFIVKFIISDSLPTSFELEATSKQKITNKSESTQNFLAFLEVCMTNLVALWFQMLKHLLRRTQATQSRHDVGTTAKVTSKLSWRRFRLLLSALGAWVIH